MKKKKKMLLGATLALTAALALGAGTLGASASVSGFNDFIKEDFNSGSLNGDVWQTPAEGIELINVEPSLTYRIYHQKSVSTKEEVTVADTDVLVVEYDMQSIDVEGGFWGVTYGAQSTDLTLENAICFYGTSQIFFGGTESTIVYNADLTSQRWIAWSRDAVTRIVIYPDGAQKMYQDGTLIAQVQAKDAGAAQKVRNGYLGIAFSGATSESNVTSVFNYFKIGHAAVADTVETDAITWDIVDDSADKAGLSDDFVSNQSGIQGWITSAAYIVSAENGGSLLSKEEIPEVDHRIGNALSVSADLNTTGMTGGSAKFAFGIDKTDKNIEGSKTLAAGVNAKDGKFYLTVWEGNVVKAEKEITLANGKIKITYNGNGTLTAAYAGVSVTAAVANAPFGLFAYGSSNGAQAVQVDNIQIRVAGSYVQNPAKSAAVNFDGLTSVEAIDANAWHVGSASSPDYTDGGLRVSDGKLSFFNAADGSVISSKEKFQNFVLQFDVPYIEREGQEDDDGNITRTVSTWIGLTFGMESAETLFSAENQKMIYMGPGTIDLLNAKFDDGSTRIWAPQDLWNTDFAGKTVTVRLVAKDNSLSLAYRVEGEDESVLDTPKAVISNIDTYGHVGIQCTQNGNFDVDNLILINTDETENYTLTKKTPADTQVKAGVGEKVTGKIDLGDMVNKSAAFTPVEKDGLKLNADGSYEYTAPAAKPEGKVEFSYSVTIDDWKLGGWYSPAGEASRYTVNGKIVVDITDVSKISVTAPTKTEYTIGEELDLSGMVVKAEMSDGSEKILQASEYTIDTSAFDANKEGEYEIKVTYRSQSVTFTVKVVKQAGGCGSSVVFAGGAGIALAATALAAAGTAVRRKKAK